MNWQQQLKEKFGSSISRTFILHGNTQDYVAGAVGQTLRGFLVGSFINKFEIVVVYSRSGGFWFPTPRMKQRFLEVVGLVVARPASPASSGLAAALAQQTGASSSGPDTALAQVGSQPAASLGLLSKLLAYRNQDNQPRAAVIL